MPETSLPSDFDWVTARAKCSAAEIFESLRQLALGNVAQINTFRGGTNPQGPRFKFSDADPRKGRGFFVWDTFSATERRAVDFWLLDDVIRVEQSARTPIDATLTLNDDGQCRFKVGTDELDNWQLLRRALEWLFFER